MSGDLTVEDVFGLADGDIRVNTAYPLCPSWFSDYRARGDLFDDVHDASYYIHIPFCKSLCRYCEYTRFKSGDEEIESHYLDLLERQADDFSEHHEISLVRGVDIGGGTPTSLSLQNFRRLMKIRQKLLRSAKRDVRFESSIEFSIDTISDLKIEEIAQAGIKRVSTGLQVAGAWFDKEFGSRWLDDKRVTDIHGLFLRYGVTKMNLDVMYGFNGQPLTSIKDTLDAIRRILPEQVTLYEVRYNTTGLCCSQVTRSGNYDLYRMLYEGLIDIGYNARFGQNAFTRVDGLSVSSYIASRMEDALPYKGLGAAAQSMSDVGISYNSLKGVSSTIMPKTQEIREQDVYRLPGEELAAKYISVALYDGCFNLKTVSRLLGSDSHSRFSEELLFLQDQGLARCNDMQMVVLTEKGVRYSGAIGALFWPRWHIHDIKH